MRHGAGAWDPLWGPGASVRERGFRVAGRVAPGLSPGSQLLVSRTCACKTSGPRGGLGRLKDGHLERFRACGPLGQDAAWGCGCTVSPRAGSLSLRGHQGTSGKEETAVPTPRLSTLVQLARDLPDQHVRGVFVLPVSQVFLSGLRTFRFRSLRNIQFLYSGCRP